MTWNARTDDQPDDRTRAALRAIADAPAPPSLTTLEHVMRRGRRRALVQRGATVAAAIGVIAAIGVGGVLLRSATEGRGVAPADPPSSTAPSDPAGPPELERIPGWEFVHIGTERQDICPGLLDAADARNVPLPPRDLVETGFADAVRQQTGSHPETAVGTWGDTLPYPMGTVGAVVEMGTGPGIVDLEVAAVKATPEKAADDAIITGGCAPPLRKTLPDGTVLQLYQPEFEDENPKQLKQLASVFRADGWRFELWMESHGKPPYVDSRSRVRLPLDSAQLAGVAESLGRLDL
jgi:hypothetical protein